MKISISRVAGAVSVALMLSSGAWAADQIDHRYDATVKQAEANYDAAKAQCKALSGNQKDVCMQRAEADYTKAKADAKVQKKGSEQMKDAREDKRDAEYKVAKEKCDALSGAAKDACVDRAKTQFMQ